MNMSQQKDNSFMCDINKSRASRWREVIITLHLLYLECFTQPQYKKFSTNWSKVSSGPLRWLGFGALVL